MPRADFFAKLGLFVVEDFFDAETCARLRAQMRASDEFAPAKVFLRGYTSPAVNEERRSTKVVVVPPPTQSFVTERLLALMPRVAEHFGVALEGCQTPLMLRYEPGDFFATHVDMMSEPGVPRFTRQRRVSVVVFLNDEADDDEDEPPRDGDEAYGGGSLTFYGLIKEGPWGRFGLPLAGEAGLLVAFRPDLVHEVKPVTRGERYTVASWFI